MHSHQKLKCQWQHGLWMQKEMRYGEWNAFLLNLLCTPYTRKRTRASIQEERKREKSRRFILLYTHAYRETKGRRGKGRDLRTFMIGSFISIAVSRFGFRA